MIDALGFKGIWRRPDLDRDPERILQKMQRLKKKTLEDIDGDPFLSSLLEQGVFSEKPMVRFLSDTIFAGVVLPTIDHGEEVHRQGYALYSLIGRMSKVLEEAAVENPTLAYRGCITLGSFMSDDVFILGEGVDEASSMMDQAEGAFVWLSPRAKVAWERFGSKAAHLVPSWKEWEASAGLVPYSVPLKNGGHFRTYAVSPFAKAIDGNRRRDIIRWIKESFDSEALAVQVKKQNTMEFLNEASKHRVAELPTP